jgi:hypothetical protein
MSGGSSGAGGGGTGGMVGTGGKVGAGGAPSTGGATGGTGVADGAVGTGGTVTTGATGGTIGTGGTRATGGTSGTGGTGVDSGTPNGCTCTGGSTTLECFCAKFGCPQSLFSFSPDAGASQAFSTWEEYADCNLVLITKPPGIGPDRYVFERSTGRLVGARYGADVPEACPWDRDAGSFRVLTAGQFPQSTCVRSKCEKGTLPDVMSTCADAGI